MIRFIEWLLTLLGLSGSRPISFFRQWLLLQLFLSQRGGWDFAEIFVQIFYDFERQGEGTTPQLAFSNLRLVAKSAFTDL
jgi:hypothetical protein